MVKTSLLSTAALAAICSTSTIVEAFSTTSTTCQSSPRINALSASLTNNNNKCASSITSPTRLQMSFASRHGSNELRRNNNNHSHKKFPSSLFPVKQSQQLATTVSTLLHRLRKSLTILMASLAILLSSSSSSHFVPHAHAASSSAAATTSVVSKSSLLQRLNPFQTKSTNQLIDEYVRDRLFADDEYDPVESAYREAYSDYAPNNNNGEGGAGSYPTLLAETASAALGKKQLVDFTSTSSSTTNTAAGGGETKKDGITAILIQSSDFLQKRLKISASTSYYLIGAGSILSLCILPGSLGVLYQGLQRLQIDKSEMKMYGKISDMDATVKRVSDDDDDEDDDDE